VLPTGTKVRCWFSDSGSVFTIDNAPASDDVQALLSEVVKSEGGTETSKLMDPAKAVALGATWKMNIPAFRKVLGPVLSGAMKKLSGTVTFASIDSSGALPVATITARAEAPMFTLRFGDMPSKSTFVADISLTVPLDNRYPAEALSTSSRQTVSMSQGNARMDMIVASSRKCNRCARDFSVEPTRCTNVVEGTDWEHRFLRTHRDSLRLCNETHHCGECHLSPVHCTSMGCNPQLGDCPRASHAI
jgi:hypothetical protein